MEERLSARPLPKGAPNFRDFGGYATRDGRRVRRGRLFRSQVLSELEDEEVAVLGGLGIRAVCDLRSSDEQARQVNRWPADAILESVLPTGVRDVGSMKPSEWLKRLQATRFDPAAATEEMRQVYRRMPSLYAGRVRALFAYLDRHDAGPVLVHCTAGKDRTGFTCAMVLGALGVPDATILDDYLESAKWFTLDSIRTKMEKYVGGPVPAEALGAMGKLAGVDASYLAASLETIEASHGSVDAWLAAEAGVDAAARERLRGRLLEG